MKTETIKARLKFLQDIENLKNVMRYSYTSKGRQESTAEHTWRLCLMAMIFEDELENVDILKVLKMCLIHDLGETLNGDIPAIMKDLYPNKGDQEKYDLFVLTHGLDENPKSQIRQLFDEYENASSAEAKVVKALDKLETILQHNQGINPQSFNYAFNLSYGEQYMSELPLFEKMRAIIDTDTKKNFLMNITIRDEQPEDIKCIDDLTKAAFLNEEHSSHTEQFIVDSLRKNGQLTISLVAVENSSIVGHVAISPVTISSGETGWYGLGPISVWPNKQGLGIGSLLMNASLEKLKQLGGKGCVLLGDPNYYSRFGFKSYSDLNLPGVPNEYFQAISFINHIPTGDVSYHEAFDATE